MKYSETLKYVVACKHHNKALIEKGLYDTAEIYDILRKIRENSADEKENIKHSYTAQIGGWKIELGMRFPIPGVYTLEVKNSENHFSSYSDWINVPNELLNHLIWIKNVLKDYLEDKIEWPFSSNQTPTSAEL